LPKRARRGALGFSVSETETGDGDGDGDGNALLRRRPRPLTRQMKPARPPRHRRQRPAKRPTPRPRRETIAPALPAIARHAARRQRPTKVIRRQLEHVAEKNLAIRRPHVAIPPTARREVRDPLFAPSHHREVHPRRVRGALARIHLPVAPADRRIRLVARARSRPALPRPFPLSAQPRGERAIPIRRAPGVVMASARAPVRARRMRNRARIALARAIRPRARLASRGEEGETESPPRRYAHP
jgi:hypothetical protein